MGWNLEDYEPVEARLERFWSDHRTGRVSTDLLAHNDGHYIVKALVWKDATTEHPDATGLAEETVGSTPVNKTAALENCETSAIGRALANLGYAAKGKRPSREEMDKPAREYSSHSDEPVKGKYNCPHCGSQVYDNRARNKDNGRPLWSCSNDGCGGGSKKKQGDGRWPWGSYEEDPGEAGLIGPAPVREDFDAPEVPMPEPRDDYDEMTAPF